MTRKHAFIPLEDRGGASLERHVFKGLSAARRSRAWAFLQVFVSWLFTLSASLALFGVLYFYSEEMDIMNKTTKRQFNAIVTGLSIILGLSVTRGLNEMVGMLRWYLLSRRYYSVGKIEFILQAESVRKVISLGFKTKRPKVQASALFWFLLVVASQVAVAMLGLSYSVEVADHQALVVKPGQVLVPDMSKLEPIGSLQGQAAASPSVLEYMANSYGTMSITYTTGTEDQLPIQGQLRDAADALMFCGDLDCRYVFYEQAAPSGDSASNDDTLRLFAATSRSINATARCESWPVLATSTDQNIISLNTTSGQPLNVTFPVVPDGNQTVFYTDTSTSCGPGCAAITAMEISPSASWYYNCTLTVGPVANATQPQHEVTDTVRMLAARGIALMGFLADDEEGPQLQMYPAQSAIGFPVDGRADVMAVKMARFAIGVIAVTAENNSPVSISGSVPEQAVTLKVEHWGYVLLILLLVTMLQLLLGVSAALVASRVVIPTGGPVALAQIIRPLTKYISDEKTQGEGTRRWMYKSRYVPSEGRYDLYMEEEEEVARMDDRKWSSSQSPSHGVDDQ